MDKDKFIKTQKKFNKWVETVFKIQPPDNVIGYYFLVYPTNRQTYSVLLLGNSKIYSEYQYWAVGTPFVSKPSFTLGSFVDLENPFDTLRSLIKNYITTDTFKDSYLDKANAIIVGTHLDQETIK